MTSRQFAPTSEISQIFPTTYASRPQKRNRQSEKDPAPKHLLLKSLRFVIPTGASRSRREREAEWRDLLFLHRRNGASPHRIHHNPLHVLPRRSPRINHLKMPRSRNLLQPRILFYLLLRANVIA